MTRKEFLEKLKEELASDLSMPLVQDNIDYYNNYIIEEVQKGRSEEEVIGELGDPWAIARTLIDSQEGKESASQEDYYNQERQSYVRGQEEGSRVHVFGMNTWWKKLLLILGVAGIIFLIVAVVSGIFSLLMPVLLPLLVVMLIIRMFRAKR